MSEFIILYLNLLFFFFLLLMCVTQGNTKINVPERPDYSILCVYYKGTYGFILYLTMCTTFSVCFHRLWLTF